MQGKETMQRQKNYVISYYRKHYVEAKLLVESSINLTASDFLLGSRTNTISAAAALCINESAASKNKAKMTIIHKTGALNMSLMLPNVDFNLRAYEGKTCLPQSEISPAIDCMKEETENITIDKTIIHTTSQQKARPLKKKKKTPPHRRGGEKEIKQLKQGKKQIQENLIAGRSASKTLQMSFSVSVAGAVIKSTLWKNLICINEV